MRRYVAATHWFINAAGTHPEDKDLGRSIYRGLEFPHETAWTRSPQPLGREADALRLAR